MHLFRKIDSKLSLAEAFSTSRVKCTKNVLRSVRRFRISERFICLCLLTSIVIILSLRCGARNSQNLGSLKYWEIIADNLKKAGWSWGCVSALDSNGRTIWIVDAHRGDGKWFIMRADEKLNAFLELQSAIGGRLIQALSSQRYRRAKTSEPMTKSLLMILLAALIPAS